MDKQESLNNIKIKTKIIPIHFSNEIIGVPFDISPEKLKGIISTFSESEKSNDKLLKELFVNLEKINDQTSKYFLINQMVATIADISQDLVNKGSTLPNNDVKTMACILARLISTLGAAQLLFNFSYYIEFITILRMIFEQCGYVCLWAEEGKKPKKGPQSVNISFFSKLIPSATSKLYGELSETAHLDIYKDSHKKMTVNNEYIFENNNIAIASNRQTLSNYHIFEDVFVMLVDTIDFFISKFFNDDVQLLKYLEIVKLNKDCIVSMSKNGNTNQKDILKNHLRILQCINDFPPQIKEILIQKYGSLDSAIKFIKKEIDK